MLILTNLKGDNGGTVTGRLSYAQNPNLTAIPAKTKIYGPGIRRSLFIPEEKRTYGVVLIILNKNQDL